MRIGVISDIHGNLVALEAVLRDLEAQSPDEIWCGGDLAWGGPWGRECIERVRSEGWITVKGNTDVWVTGDPQTIENQEDRAALAGIAEAHNISADHAQWLLNLPLGHSAPGSILLVHGTPESPFVAPEPDAPAAEFANYEGRARVVVYGHVHVAFVRQLVEGTIVCNPGSVGMPKDSDLASYLLIDVQGADVSFTHRRVAYDRTAAVDRARQLGGPIEDIFCRWVRPE
ncbi:MAG: metallophosphoesterase family protein [Actinomycetota bacterium]